MIGLGLKMWNRRQAALPPIPGPATGQTPIHAASEYFASDRNSGSLGNFVSVSGSALGGLANAPTFLDGAGTRRNVSAAVRKQTAAEITAGTNSFTARIDTPVGQQLLGMRCILVRPGDWHNYVNANVIRMHANNDTVKCRFILNKSGGTTVISSYFDWGATSGSPQTVTISDSQWVLLWFAWEFTGGNEYIRLYAQVDGGSPVLLDSQSDANWAGHQAGYFTLPYVGSANQAPFEGRVAFCRLYSCDTYAHAQQAPTDFLWPSNLPTSYTVTSWTDFATKWNSNTILGRKKNWKRGNTLVDYSTLATASDRAQWWSDWIASPATPTGDTVNLPSGTSDLGSTDLLGWPYGVKIQGNSTTLDMADSMPSAWTRPDAVGASKVWLYGGTGVVNRSVWIVNGDGTRVQFNPTFAADFAAAKAQLQAKEYSVYTDPADGKTYVCLPAGTDPNTLTWRGSKGIPHTDLTGSYTTGITFLGGGYWDYSKLSASSERGIQNTPHADYSGKTLTVISAGFFETSKHGFTAAGSTSDGGIFRYRCSYGLAPPAMSGASNEYGVPQTAYSLEVDYSAEPSNVFAPGRGVFGHYQPTITTPIAVEGTTGGRAFNGSEAACFAHGNPGYTAVFAVGMTTGCTAIQWYAGDNSVPSFITDVVVDLRFG